MAQITKDMLIGDILRVAPDSVPLFLDMGMHCLGCPASLGESLEQACLVHGVDVDEMVQKLNEMASTAETETDQK
jgi:hybrid cluster-associated redox disulfide protein